MTSLAPTDLLALALYGVLAFFGTLFARIAYRCEDLLRRVADHIAPSPHTLNFPGGCLSTFKGQPCAREPGHTGSHARPEVIMWNESRSDP